jgi:type 1 glutamine amidotransferase
MERREMLLTAGATLLGPCALWNVARCAPAKTQKLLCFTRNVGYYHSVVQRQGDALSHAERVLVEVGKRMGVEVECSKDGRVFDGDLSRFDAFAFYTNGDLTVPNSQKEPPMSASGKQRLLDAVADGKGFVAFHSSCASWRTPGKPYENRDDVDPYIALVGGEFIAHGPQQQATMKVTSPGFPGLSKSGNSFRMLEEWYALKNFAKDLHVILVQETAGMRGACYQRPPFPATWARRQKKGRVFFTSMAHRENTWMEQPFQQIAMGGLGWVLGRLDADVAPNIDKVTPQASQLSAA